MDILGREFIELAERSGATPHNAGIFWAEIEAAYDRRERRYHGLQHLRQIYSQLVPLKNEIAGWDAVLFAMYYHDVICAPGAQDNEERSAELAELRLREIGASRSVRDKVAALISATKTHEATGDRDCDLFSDADLSVLGQEWENYSDYLFALRQEYAEMSDEDYSRGRRAELERLLAMKPLFKTKEFFHKFEDRARTNIGREIGMLSLSRATRA